MQLVSVLLLLNILILVVNAFVSEIPSCLCFSSYLSPVNPNYSRVSQFLIRARSFTRCESSTVDPCLRKYLLCSFSLQPVLISRFILNLRQIDQESEVDQERNLSAYSGVVFAGLQRLAKTMETMADDAGQDLEFEWQEDQDPNSPRNARDERPDAFSDVQATSRSDSGDLSQDIEEVYSSSLYLC